MIPKDSKNNTSLNADKKLPSEKPTTKDEGYILINGRQSLDLQNEHSPLVEQPQSLLPAKESQPEKTAGKEKEKEKPPQASFVDLFHFVAGRQRILLWAAIIFSVVQGLALPLITLLLGDLTNSVATTGNPQVAEDSVNNQFKRTIYIGLGVLGAAFIASMLWNILSAIQTKKIKLLYFKKLLEQNSAWYDKTRIDLLSANFIDQVSSFTTVFSTKMHLIFMNYATFIGGLGIGFIKGWLLTLFIILLTPMFFFGMFFFIKAVQKSEETQRTSYAEAGSTSDECFTFIKTVKSLNGEEHEIARYTKHCENSKNVSVKFGYKAGLLWGVFFFTVLFVYAMAYLIGSRLIANGWVNDNVHRVYNVGDCLTIFFAVITGIFALGNIGPLQKAIEAAKVAIALIMKITREDQEEKSGDYVPAKISGRIDFENVSFSYPSNPEVPVLKDVSFSILPGQKVAFVGPSGSGKSTVVQLIERFYDPTSGRILLDGVDIKKYDLNFLRRNIGLVSQQPILFAESVKYNILLGIDKVEEVSEQQIWSALDEAMAGEFVRKFNGQLGEFVGTQGGQLSGGQKQRIAIGRALIRHPPIFLFDEATSALDRKNEIEIQKTLEKIAENTTSLTVAHRLTTIKNCDQLFVLQNGELVQAGTHEQLIADLAGLYHKLVEHQIDEVNINKEDDEEGNGDDQEKEDEQLLVDAFRTEDKELKADGKSFEKSMDLQALPAMKLQSQDSHQISGDPKLISVKQASAVFDRPEPEPSKRKKITLGSLIGPEKKFIFLGLITALTNGAVMPVFGYLLGLMVERMGYLDFFKSGAVPVDPAVTKDSVIRDIDVIVGAMVVTGFGSFFCSFLQWAFFNHVGELFTFTLRTRYFRRLMYQDLVYFDKEENQPGSVSSRLALDCKTINVLISTYIGSIVQSLSSMAVGIIIGLIFSWRIALVMMALVPLVFISGFVDTQMMTGKSAKETTIQGSDLLPETLNNMKVVRSLNAQKVIYARFEGYSEAHRSRSLKFSWLGSFAFGFSQFSIFLIYAVIFRVGAKFQVDYGEETRSFFVAIFAIIFGGYGAGMANQFLGGIAEAKVSADKILEELNSRSMIERDPLDPEINAFSGKLKNLKPEVVGTIEFKSVDFTYAGRKNKVLNHLSFKIPPNQSSAFVGGSGSGKSTIMQMLLRFYDPQRGAIFIDGVDIRDIDIAHLRAIFGIVRQEPTLFNGTIDYNVKYNNSAISEEAVENACESANALEFIYGTPEGFQRDVGNRGEKMSGGQKQRIAIARILVRDPKILLFDEATSALDSNSEAIVQSALEKISQDRASISIAHRISTIKGSDVIFVLETGKIIEKGTYVELMNKKGRFSELAQN